MTCLTERVKSKDEISKTGSLRLLHSKPITFRFLVAGCLERIGLWEYDSLPKDTAEATNDMTFALNYNGLKKYGNDGRIDPTTNTNRYL